MSFFKFDDDDLFINTVKAYPEYKFYIHSGTIYVGDMPHVAGVNTDNIIGVPKGFISLYEYNIDRAATQNIYPFIIKDATRQTFKANSASKFGSQQDYGQQITSSYNMSASFDREFFNSSTRAKIVALKNTLNHYSHLSPHYEYKSQLGWDKSSQQINLISIPSILYGSSIKKGSVRLRYYVSGSLVGEVQDTSRNGDLIQTGPVGSTGSGSVAGSVLYKEGFLLLTGSWDLNTTTIQTDSNGASKWIHFGYGANDDNTIAATTVSASFLMEYSGTTKTEALTMFAHAKYEDLNWSNNPTFLSKSADTSYSQNRIATGSNYFIQYANDVKNVVNSKFTDEKQSFEKTVYISKIGIYDQNKKLIAIAKLATPVRKTENNQFTFKLKLDM